MQELYKPRHPLDGSSLRLGTRAQLSSKAKPRFFRPTTPTKNKHVSTYQVVCIHMYVECARAWSFVGGYHIKPRNPGSIHSCAGENDRCDCPTLVNKYSPHSRASAPVGVVRFFGVSYAKLSSLVARGVTMEERRPVEHRYMVARRLEEAFRRDFVWFGLGLQVSFGEVRYGGFYKLTKSLSSHHGRKRDGWCNTCFCTSFLRHFLSCGKSLFRRNAAYSAVHKSSSDRRMKSYILEERAGPQE